MNWKIVFLMQQGHLKKDNAAETIKGIESRVRN